MRTGRDSYPGMVDEEGSHLIFWINASRGLWWSVKEAVVRLHFVDASRLGSGMGREDNPQSRDLYAAGPVCCATGQGLSSTNIVSIRFGQSGRFEVATKETLFICLYGRPGGRTNPQHHVTGESFNRHWKCYEPTFIDINSTWAVHASDIYGLPGR
jgi:hypothetical protein